SHRDAAAVTHLVECNLRFVVSCARRYRDFGVPILDLIHEGNLGLIEAARRFDPGRHVRVITYAVWGVRQAMMDALCDQTRAFSVPPKLLGRLRTGREDVSLSDLLRSGVHDGDAFEVEDSLAGQQVAPVEDQLIHQAELAALAAALHDLDSKE